jgi:hypothetical protein
MARPLTCQIGRWIANLFKACLFDKCGLVIAASFSVGFDQSKTGSCRAVRSAGLAGGMTTAAGVLGTMAAPGRLAAPTKLTPAATVRKRRRVGSRGGNIMGWSIADLFVDGVIYTLSAWIMGFIPLVVRVRAGAEAATSPRLAFAIS